MVFFRRCACALIALVLAAGSALAGNAPLVEGGLELTWGDAAPTASVRTPRFDATLVDARGLRYALDPAQALRASGDLYALAGKSVVASLNGTSAFGQLGTDAMVPSIADTGLETNAVTGAQPWVSLLCKFSDIGTEPKNLAYFSTMLSNQTGRLDHYWREVSYNKVNVAGSVGYGWFTLPHPRSYYVTTGSNGAQTADLTKLFTDCTAAADATVNFAPFVGGINLMFNGDLDGYAWGGNRYATLDGVNRSWRTTWEPPWGYANEAPLAHEMGHGFGLPHANNSDGDADPYDNPWDVMSDAWHNASTDATYQSQPKHINIYSRDRLGWVDAARKLTLSTDVTQNGIVLDRASLAGSTHTQMIVVTIAGTTTHYYTIEARKRTAAGTYEGALAGDAVIIHDVVTSRAEPAWSVDAASPVANVSNNEGSMFKPGETYTFPGGAGSVTVVGNSADGNGFVVNVVRGAGGPPPETIFGNGFQ